MSIDSSFATKDEFEGDRIPEFELPKSPDTLERDIDARRANIENIVDALESKFSPGQLFDQALAFTKGNGGEFFSNLGTSVKNNPVPVLLATVGITWLMLGQNQKPRGDENSMLGHLGEKISDAATAVGDSLQNAKDQGRQYAHRMSDKAGHLADSVRHTVDGLQQGAAEGSAGLGEKVTGAAGEAQQALHRQGRQLQGSFQYLLQEQPLALAAIGIALGAAIGAAIPSTQKENEIMGQTSDKLTGKVKTSLDETWKSVTEAGKNILDEVKQSSTAKPSSADTREA